MERVVFKIYPGEHLLVVEEDGVEIMAARVSEELLNILVKEYKDAKKAGKKEPK